jgi:hypothetical protein
MSLIGAVYSVVSAVGSALSSAFGGNANGAAAAAIPHNVLMEEDDASLRPAYRDALLNKLREAPHLLSDDKFDRDHRQEIREMIRRKKRTVIASNAAAAEAACYSVTAHRSFLMMLIWLCVAARGERA